MKIGITNDHRGVKAKHFLTKYLNLLGYTVIDYGTDSEESADFPDYAKKLGIGIKEKEVDLGIAICGTGIGMSIAANKVKGIRAARCVTNTDAHLARIHNNANVLCLGINDTPVESLCSVIDTFLNSNEVVEDRHKKRIAKIINYEERA